LFYTFPLDHSQRIMTPPDPDSNPIPLFLEDLPLPFRSSSPHVIEVQFSISGPPRFFPFYIPFPFWIFVASPPILQDFLCAENWGSLLDLKSSLRMPCDFRPTRGISMSIGLTVRAKVLFLLVLFTSPNFPHPDEFVHQSSVPFFSNHRSTQGFITSILPHLPLPYSVHLPVLSGLVLICPPLQAYLASRTFPP